MSKKSPAPRESPGYQPKATSSRSAYALIAAGVVVAALVIGGFVWNATKSYPPVDDAVLAQNAAIIVGGTPTPENPIATVDVFEDPACPHCREMEVQSGNALAAAAQAGQLRIRYHLLTFMDSSSPSGDYSSRAAGAILCVARNGDDLQVFTRLHGDLFAQAPTGEADSDLTNTQMAELAGRSGANEATRQCIADGALVGEAVEMGKTSSVQLANSNDGNVATPTVLVAGEQVPGILDGDAWVAQIIAEGAPTP